MFNQIVYTNIQYRYYVKQSNHLVSKFQPVKNQILFRKS
ncbi:unnamed protein product [Schistosoma margrebowiei]|uniref:Uncharacterized protein n=1 Tax=Schistosoma margrebowiei TaxID=48269 RepID=A0A3P8E0Q9_9TREM|nr:unnamed protein product [Schistosoma margrebowiei]